MSYFKCPSCGAEDFNITLYSIENAWTGKVSIDDSLNDLKDQASDLRGYSEIIACCDMCSYSISIFEGTLNQIRNKMIAMSSPTVEVSK